MRLEHADLDYGAKLGIRAVRINRAVRLSRELRTFKRYRFRRRLSVRRLAMAKIKLRAYIAARFRPRKTVRMKGARRA